MEAIGYILKVNVEIPWKSLRPSQCFERRQTNEENVLVLVTRHVKACQFLTQFQDATSKLSIT